MGFNDPAGCPGRKSSSSLCKAFSSRFYAMYKSDIFAENKTLLMTTKQFSCARNLTPVKD